MFLYCRFRECKNVDRAISLCMEKQKKCRKCGSAECVKWGFRKYKQCYRCKKCDFQFTREDERKSEKDVFRAVALYCAGLSFRTIGALTNYHNTTILGWIVQFAKKNLKTNPEKRYNGRIGQNAPLFTVKKNVIRI